MAIKLNKVLISDPVDEAAVEILRARNLQVDLRTGLPKDQLLAIIPEYDALIVRSGTQVTADVIQAAKNLKLIGRAGVGVDNIDLPAATKAGIIVINAPGGNTISAVELTCTMLLASSRYVAQACSSLKNGVWDRKSFTGNELKGKTLAIIGLGRIGREVAIRMQSFEMRTIGFDPIIPAEVTAQFGVQSLSLEEIWPQADYITVHTPLIPQTKDLINATTLAKCKKGVRIINVARGGIINEDDLLAALQSGHVAGAGLDVFLEEPPKNTPLVQHPKVVCTPHLGASTKEAQNNVAKEIALQFLDILDSKAVPGVVNAPLLSEMLKHENLIWTRLGTDLGKLAAAGSPTLQSLKVTVTGKLATAAVKLIKESVSGSGQDGGDSPFNSPGQDGGSPFGSTTPGEGIPPFSPPPGPGVKPRKVPKILPITPLVKRVPASPTIKLLPLHTHSILHDNTVTVTVLTTVMNYVPVVYTSMVEHPPATIRMPPEVLTVTPPPETVSVTPEPVIIRVPGPTVRMSPVTLTSIKTLPPKIIRPEPVTMTVEKAKILPPQTMLRVVPVLQSPKLVIVRAPPITIQEPATTVYVFSTVRSPPETFVQVQTKLQVLTSTILKLVQREPRTIFRTVVPRVVVQPRSTVPRPVPVSPRWGQLPGSGTPRTNRPSNGTPKGHPPGAPTGSVSGLGSNNIGGYNLEEITPPGSSDRIFRFVGTPPLGGASSHPFTPVTSTAIVPGGGPSRYSRSTGPWTGPRPMGPPSGRTGNGTQACSSSVFGSAAQKRPNNGGNCINGGILAFGPPRPQQCSNCSTNGNQNCMFGQMAGSYTASTGACGPSKQPDGNYNECMSDISRCKGPEVEQPSSNLRKPISRDDSDRNDEDDESGPSNGEDNDNADQDEVFLSDLVNNS